MSGVEIIFKTKLCNCLNKGKNFLFRVLPDSFGKKRTKNDHFFEISLVQNNFETEPKKKSGSFPSYNLNRSNIVNQVKNLNTELDKLSATLQRFPYKKVF